MKQREHGYRQTLWAYAPLVRFIASVMGPRCEVVLQDAKQPDHSIIAICNGHISGRRLGGPLTSLALKIISSAGERPQQVIANYESKNSHGENLISSMYFIFDDDGAVIGTIEVNILSMGQYEYTPVKTEHAMVCEAAVPVPLAVNEYIDTSTEQLILHAVDEILMRLGKNADMLTNTEKKKTIGLLRKNGIFKIRRAVPEVARILGMADSTVYRYLSQLSSR